MNRRDILALGLGSSMVATSVFATLARPTRHLTDLVGMPDLGADIPTRFAGWQVDVGQPVIMPSPDVQARLDKIYNQVLARTYVDKDGRRVMLSIAYGGDQSDGTSVHRPEVCYPTQGFAVLSNDERTLQVVGRNLRVRDLSTSMGERWEPVSYFLVVGGTVVTTGLEQKMVQISYGLKGLVADGMLVRVSTIDKVTDRALTLNHDFLRELSASLPPRQLERYFGRTA